jgi:hypothetical protein
VSEDYEGEMDGQLALFETEKITPISVLLKTDHDAGLHRSPNPHPWCPKCLTGYPGGRDR